jgi:hypothetical protein
MADYSAGSTYYSSTNYLKAADGHNWGNAGTSWFDPNDWAIKLGNAGKLALTSVASGVNSFYNTGVAVGNFFGANLQENDTATWISGMDSDLGRYYRDNQEYADLGGMLLGSLIPGLGGVRLLNMGQKALTGWKGTGFIGGNLSKATGLLIPKTEMYVSAAADAITKSTGAFKVLNTNTAKAIGAGLWQNTLEAAAFETMVQATMFKSPILEKQDIGDIFTNIAVGGALGGGIAGAFNTAKILGKAKQLESAEAAARMPFRKSAQPVETTSPSERIIQLAQDNESTPSPIKLFNPDGTIKDNNFQISFGEMTEKIAGNNNRIRSAFHELTGGDVNLGNLFADAMLPGKVTPKLEAYQGSAQLALDNLSGAEVITRAGTLSKLEQQINQNKALGLAEPREIAVRHVRLTGEGAGTITEVAPTVLNLGDKFPNKEAIISHVRKQNFSVKKLEDYSKLSGKKAHEFAEMRHVWANELLTAIPENASVHINDIALLERAFKDGNLGIRIIEGEGVTLNSFYPGSLDELWKIIKDSKIAVADTLMQGSTKQAKRAYKNRNGFQDKAEGAEKLVAELAHTEETVAKIANVRRAFLEGEHAASDVYNLMARQSDAGDYLKMLQEKGLSTKDAIDPLFQPTHARVVYSLDPEKHLLDGNLQDALALYASKQQLYRDQAAIVSARVLGEQAADLLPLGELLNQANRVGSGATLFAAENANYGTLGSGVARIGAVTRAAEEKFRKTVSDALTPVLVGLGKNPTAAIEIESINQKVTRSAKLWKLDTVQKALVSIEKEGVDSELIDVTTKEALEFLETHISLSGNRTQLMKELRASQGFEDVKHTDIYRPLRPDLKAFPHYAFVRDEYVTETGHLTMLHAASEKELLALAEKVPTRYKVIYKKDINDFEQARQSYDYNRTLHENYINQDLVNKGVFSNFFPKTDPQRIVDDILRQHLNESSMLVKETIRNHYAPEFKALEDLGHSYSKAETSQFKGAIDKLEASANNPYLNYVKTALNISKTSEHPLINGVNKLFDESFSKFYGALKSTWDNVKSPEELAALNGVLDRFGVKPAYYDSALIVLANHEAPKGVLTKFVRNANSLLSLFTLGLDPINSLNNAIGSNILRMTELKHITDAIKTGDTALAGELSKLAKIKLPGVEAEVLAPAKLMGQAIKNFWNDKGNVLLNRYKADGYIKDRLEQLKLLVDDVTLKGTETVAELETRMTGAFARAKGLAETGEKFSGNKLAEEFNRFISADVMRQITDMSINAGHMDAATAKSYINTFVNRVEGNIIASQRPLVFQGPIGQAIGLFQSYQFNLMQQLFRYSAEGKTKDIGMLMGLQSTLYGVQSLPGFQAINTHIIGKLSGNTEHRDAYDAIYGATGKTAGDFLLYGLPSNILKGNIYSRGDINPRHLTILPTSMQEIPIVAGWGKLFGSMYETAGKVKDGGAFWNSILQGVEHNGISRPLAGMAQVLQGASDGVAYSTSNKGSILYSNDLFSWSSAVRLAGARPLDEAVLNDALFRRQTYAAMRNKQINAFGETVKTTMINGGEPSGEDMARFMEHYVKLGGKQAQFNKWSANLYKDANIPQTQQIEMNLNSPFSYKLQLLMGGERD